MKTYTINYLALPVLAAFFSYAKNLSGSVIRFFAPGDCNHAGLITSDHGQLFATEEQPQGLEENSLEKYRTDRNRIVALYYWTGWDNTVRRDAAETYLAEIRRKAGETSKYDFFGLLSFVPVIGKWIKTSKNRQWCSENVLSIHDRYGFDSGWKLERGPSPAELEILMQNRKDVRCILGYYKG